VEIKTKDTAARSFNRHYELFILPPLFGSPQTFIYGRFPVFGGRPKSLFIFLLPKTGATGLPFPRVLPGVNKKI